MNKITQLITYMKRQVHKVEFITKDEWFFSEKVRETCSKNRCGQYNNHFMCPPHIGTPHTIQEKLSKYHQGLLVIVKDKVKDAKDLESFYHSADELHEKMLDFEKRAKELDLKSFALIGGHCRLCKPCRAKLLEKQCIHKDRARPSMESLGMDVIKTCENKNVTIEFLKDEVTWVGLLLLG